jgi:hypothetical protein
MAAASVAKWVMDRVGWGSHDQKKNIYIYCPCSRYDAPQVGYLQTLVGEFKMEEKKKAHAGGENMLILSFFLEKKSFLCNHRRAPGRIAFACVAPPPDRSPSPCRPRDYILPVPNCTTLVVVGPTRQSRTFLFPQESTRPPLRIQVRVNHTPMSTCEGPSTDRSGDSRSHH